MAFITLAMILLPIYLHAVEFAPFWQQTHEHHDSVLHLIVLHFLPSLWINRSELCSHEAKGRRECIIRPLASPCILAPKIHSNMLYHYYKSMTSDPGRPEPGPEPAAAVGTVV